MDPSLVEPTFFESFKTNPFPILIAILFGTGGFVLFVAAFVSAMKRKRIGIVLGIAAAVLGLGAIVFGVNGTIGARAMTDRAVESPGLSGNDQDRLRKHGYAEAIYPLLTGLTMGALPLAGGVLSIFLARARSRKQGTTS